MEINPKWLIIGGIVVLLLVAFGRNPASEAKRRYELSKEGKDPLMQSIEEYNSGGPRGSRMFGRRGGEGTEQPVVSPPPPINFSNPTDYNAVPSYMMRSPQEYSPPNPVLPGMPQQQPANNGYYPPPPMNNNQQNNPFSPQSFDIHRQLTNGKPVLFAGTNVFTQDPTGRVIPMPDGVYSMYDGEIKLIVRGGQHIVISN